MNLEITYLIRRFVKSLHQVEGVEYLVIDWSAQWSGKITRLARDR